MASMSKFMAIESLKGDEYFTLDETAEQIAEHIIKPMTVWCPFNDKGTLLTEFFPNMVTK